MEKQFTSDHHEAKMSAYRDFVSDFPSRCLDVLEMAEKQARLRQRNVTLILMVASAGFVIPFERLSSKKLHPSGDAVKFSEASAQLDSLMSHPFVTSLLASGADSWRGGKLKSIEGDPDSWSELQKAKPLASDKTVGSVIRVIRNAFAHGNIFTYQNPIKGIVLICSNKDNDGNIKDFSFVLVSPDDFSHFLKQWFTFLTTAKVPTEVIEEALSSAA